MTFTYCILKRLASVIAVGIFASHLCSPHSQDNQPAHPRVIEVLADHDSRYKMAGLRRPEITVRAGEHIILRITATKAKNRNREGAVHGFTLLRAKDQKAVPGWDFALLPGTQEFSVIAPDEPGEYIAICTVICSEDHEGMKMRFVVTR
jgi:heme/copper-type cytochrome/quinol oxidase subunit 2